MVLYSINAIGELFGAGIGIILSVKRLTFLIIFLCFSNAFAVESIPTFFNKLFDKEVLAQTFDMTPQELISFIGKQGVDVYVPNQKNQSRHAIQFEKEKILGKYFSNAGFAPEFTHPTILINDPEDKWTLLHEFMHYLFDKKRIELKVDTDAIYEGQKNSREDFLEISLVLKQTQIFTQNILTRALSLFNEFVGFEIELAQMLTVEEISIEKTLLVLYSQGKIKHLKPAQKLMADSYISNNYSVISGQVDSYIEIKDNLQRHLGNQIDPSLEQTSQKLIWFKNELSKLVVF